MRRAQRSARQAGLTSGASGPSELAGDEQRIEFFIPIVPMRTAHVEHDLGGVVPVVGIA